MNEEARRMLRQQREYRERKVVAEVVPGKRMYFGGKVIKRKVKAERTR